MEVEAVVRRVTLQPVPKGVLDSANKYVQKLRGQFAATVRGKLDSTSGFQAITARTSASVVATIVANRQKWVRSLKSDEEKSAIKEAAVAAAYKALHHKADRALVAAAGEVVSCLFFPCTSFDIFL